MAMIGMKTSLTRPSTILPNAAPMMTPIARSTTLPRMAKLRNSFSMASPWPGPERATVAAGDKG